ncbi:hypothetical protein GCM10012275_46570 [Longimycelium tulufanense]|uniref:HTH cro/C1-type domain-containing protein n=1 Tax=Longimycelium tulufanense TaxID=907463 RepID=A0A8J3CHM5_9PSEU|nr:helix-turn-helix transcriptional regulator [Longimycelium tulufanense]GGM70815.1 hypothetical protein GCM10012275_46570 [Longimycelium tulufanense]
MADQKRDPQPHWPLGERLRVAREQAGLSQRQAAEAAGFSVTAWGQLETGLRSVGGGQTVPANPRPATIVAAARIVGVEPSEALNLAGYDPRQHRTLLQRPSAGGRPTVSQRGLAELISQLTERQRQAVLAVVEAMLEPEEADEGTGAQPAPAHHDVVERKISPDLTESQVYEEKVKRSKPGTQRRPRR